MLIVMIMLRLWLVLSLSAAAPVSSTEEKEAREDTPSVEIVIKSDALHSHSSENTNRYPRSIYIGGDVHIEVEGHNAEVNIASIFGEDASQGDHPMSPTSPGTSTVTTPTTASTATSTPKPGGTSTATTTTTASTATATTTPGGSDSCDSGRTGAGCGKSTWIQKNEKDCWYECGKIGGSCLTFCGDDGYCCRIGHGGCPAGAAEASPNHHTCVIQIAWRQKNEVDCWKKCGGKGGSCPTFCGDGGFCCRKDFDGCPAGAAEYSPNHHTCVIKTGVPNVKPYTSTPTKTECACGQVASNRVVGGKNAVVNEFPWMALLQGPAHFKKEEFGFCGGSLINDRWVVTASHCFNKDNNDESFKANRPDELRVILGVHNLYETDGTYGTYTFDVEKIILHHDYHPPPRSNDIALLKLKSRVDLNRFVPVCLPTPNKDYTGKKATVTGWGKPGSSHILQKLEGLQVVTDNVCKAAMKSKLADKTENRITPDMLCAGGEEGKDACTGDSGGPLLYKNNKQQNELIGVVSWGKDCGLKDAYGIYVETSGFVKWIKKTVEDNGGGEFCEH